MFEISTYDIILILIYAIINISIYYYTYKWIIKLEKIGCLCSKDWRRDYIKYYTVFIITYIISTVLYLLTTDKDLILVFYVNILIILSQILYIISVIQYVYRLKKEKCECSKDNIREITFIHSLILAASYTLIFFIGLYAAIMYYIYDTSTS